MMSEFTNKSILLIYPPRDKAVRTIHEKLHKGLQSLGFDVETIDLENSLKFKNENLYDKLRNIFERNIRNNNQYIFEAEKKFYNKYFYSKLIAFKPQKKKFDYILVIKPEEFSTQFIKKLSTLGNMMVGYMWDALRLFYKPGLLKNKKYFHQLYSFDKNNIKDHPELNLKFLTNYYISENQPIIQYENRSTDVFYIGALAGTLPDQRRDSKLAKITPYLVGNVEIKIHVSEKFLNNDLGIVKDKKIQYITESTTIDEALEKARNSKIVIDICKSQHIGLSFRFFEALIYQNKIITNNPDIANYDFYNPNNILIVDFENMLTNEDVWIDFQNTPYEIVPEDIVRKYSLENWARNVFQIGEFIPIKP